MSKFFRKDSESSGSDSEVSNDDVAPVVPVRGAKTVRIEMSDSEEETKRVVYSTKDKRHRELKELVRKLRNAKKIKDMNASLTIFEDMCRAYQKARSVMEKEGGSTPRFYIRYLAELEDFVNRNWDDREGRRGMSKQNSKGLATLRQKLRKYLKDFEEDIATYREEPDSEGYTSVEEGADEEEEEEKDESSSEESEDEGDSHLRKTRAGEKREGEEGDSEEETDWMSDESSSDSELEDLEGKKMEDLRRFFLKKTDEEKKAVKDKKKEIQREKVRKRGKKGAKAIDEEEGWLTVTRGGQTLDRPKMFQKDEEINHEAVLKKLLEILQARGKKGSNRREMVVLLKELKSISEANNLGMALSAKIMFMIVAGMFEYNTKMLDCMKFDTWNDTLDVVKELMDILEANPGIQCHTDLPEDLENVKDTAEPYKIDGSILAVLERLDDEFTKLLQVADCHSTDYVDKLKGETDLCAIIERVQTYFESRAFSDDDMCRIFIRRIEHVYYKFDFASLEGDTIEGTENCHNMMERLCKFIYTQDSTKRLRERAMLCHIYHQALHDRWQNARDLMLMSHLQLTIEHSDIPNQILHNRAICQLGLCAFRHGLIKEAHSALSDMQNSGRAKELLAQGLSLRSQERTPEQEKLERQRQVPYHMHVNLELLECVYLISSMLLEIPQMASRDHEMRRKMLSRSFHYQLKQSERTTLLGPPENTREHVVAASRALLAGDWIACRDFVVNEKMNAKVWNLFPRSEKVKDMVIRRIQRETLRTYLLTYSTVYTTVSITNLSSMFDLDKKSVHSLISKMIIEEELSASLDEPAECLIMHRVEPSRLQVLALQLTEKLAAFAESNDQILDPKSSQGNYNQYRSSNSNWFQNRQQGGNRGGHRGRDDGHGGNRGGRRQYQQRQY